MSVSNINSIHLSIQEMGVLSAKVAFVGDMNNNYFSFMRYLRDQGVDAHLYLYQDQCTRQPRWAPAADTYELERWEPFIHKLPFEPRALELLTARPRMVREIFAEYDIIFGSGFAAAYLARCGISLDYFLPYSIGIEHIHNVPRTGLRGIADRLVAAFQRRAVRQAGEVLVTQGDWQTEAVARSLGARVRNIVTIPMVYTRPSLPRASSEKVSLVEEWIANANFVVSCHARHDWRNFDRPYPGRNIVYSKRIDLLIRGYAKFLQQTGVTKSLLLLAQYGADVDASKALIMELGIGSCVRWFPEMTRKEIMQFLPRADVTGGEFSSAALTSGVMLESLAAGRPLLNHMATDAAMYISLTGAPLPPVLHAGSVDEIAANLENLYRNPEMRDALGKAGKEWFEKYAGRGLAERFAVDFSAAIEKKRTKTEEDI